ncbi:hypothetical protein CR492_03220 [Methylocella silvestris]|uniref:Uncharacterized protein n=1 Tax=Methylocella silvestris TaxID=199596 RepID=A0A2J7TMC5_METSI|nr:hypothetical protein CR492_03220 [Methylocella silvestris]
MSESSIFAPLTRYLELIERLSAELAAGDRIHGDGCAPAFRDLVDSVLCAQARRGGRWRSNSAAIAKLTQEPGLAPSGRLSGFALVAEEGLEPPTQGL